MSTKTREEVEADAEAALDKLPLAERMRGRRIVHGINLAARTIEETIVACGRPCTPDQANAVASAVFTMIGSLGVEGTVDVIGELVLRVADRRGIQ
jgi:hypothetical protein